MNLGVSRSAQVPGGQDIISKDEQYPDNSNHSRPRRFRLNRYGIRHLSSCRY